MVRVFANGPGDPSSIPGRVIPQTLKMVLDATLLNTQYYKVRIKGKVEQSKEKSSALPNTSAWKLSKREPSGHPRLRRQLYFTLYIIIDKHISVCVFLLPDINDIRFTYIIFLLNAS